MLHACSAWSIAAVIPKLTPRQRLLIPDSILSTLITGGKPNSKRWYNGRTLLGFEGRVLYQFLKDKTGIAPTQLQSKYDELRDNSDYNHVPNEILVEVAFGWKYFNQLTPEELLEATNQKDFTLLKLKKARINFRQYYDHWIQQLELLKINPDRVFSKMCWLRKQFGKKVEGLVAARMALGSELLKEKPTSHLGESSKTLSDAQSSKTLSDAQSSKTLSDAQSSKTLSDTESSKTVSNERI
ncbi:hypothetical protein PsorP6_009424 [Peronosclerospora sorghi]|uniref:Uncharacterized protein n=1 Tax=Peronosclerospora sorghi TaxID=230839 RepID=A0ACC0W0D1_9STRA|nr:hypothetical protein PsorP6_009424 [Peronosclerospora sorghi]